MFSIPLSAYTVGSVMAAALWFVTLLIAIRRPTRWPALPVSVVFVRVIAWSITDLVLAVHLASSGHDETSLLWFAIAIGLQIAAAIGTIVTMLRGHA